MSDGSVVSITHISRMLQFLDFVTKVISLFLTYVAVDPVAGYEYQRIGYKFHEKDAGYAVSGNAETVADYYNTFGVPGGI